MAIRVKQDAEWTKFVPEFGDNRDLPEAEQISCLIKYISQEDQDKLTDELIGQSRDGFRSKNSVKWSKANATMVNAHVKDIKNITVVKDGVDTAVKTMADMYKIAELRKLYSEIADALDATNKVSKAEEKN